jgi:hypothetical protein
MIFRKNTRRIPEATRRCLETLLSLMADQYPAKSETKDDMLFEEEQEQQVQTQEKEKKIRSEVDIVWNTID